MKSSGLAWNNIMITRGKGRRSALLFALFAALVLATGCRYTAAPADLLQKPAIAKDKEQLAEAIGKQLPRFSVLMLPHRDDYKEAIRRIDLTGDGIEEAVVTYYNEFSTPEIMVLRQTEFGWRQFVLVEQPLARDIGWLRIVDLDVDGVYELIVGWIGAFDSPNMLELYSFQGKAVRNENGLLTMKAIHSLPYRLADTRDLDGDGKPELAVLDALGTSGELEVPSYYLSLYDWEKGALAKVGLASLPQGVSLFERMLTGTIAESKHGILLEGGTGAHSMLTYMYAWDNKELKLVYPDSSRGEEGFNGTGVQSGDMNGDGIIELHRTRLAPGYESLSYADALWINEWVQWDGKSGYESVLEQYRDYTYGVRLTIPEEWQGRYTMKKPPSSSYGLVTFSYWNEKYHRIAELATIYVVPLKQWGNVESAWKDENRSYQLLYEDSGNAYLVSFVQEEPSNLTNGELQEWRDMRSIEKQWKSYMTIEREG
ncbi:hypothetical protein [Paenibacillus soyae]|uniref:VCBS repeat-containing protein n=1 Tax=Paenibacillus soyae TaxID=2969249 RepID=A0A9X2MMB1_9BACL|nr:hypothetical protein [Paenibacillus soyae]MCR2804523.1 hypothetical protein [Paenibacillus soyae]